VDELATDRGHDRLGHRHAGEDRCGAGEVERHVRKHELHDLLAEHLPSRSTCLARSQISV
jgi:hypothetical protein